MVETEARKSCGKGAFAPSPAREDASKERRGYSALVWLNLVCLDAPLVAVSWQWLFAQAFRLQTKGACTAALFLTAWLIYLADRFGDSLAWRSGMPTSLRQRFCRQYRVAWLVALVLIALADAVIIWTRVDAGTRLVGAAVGACAAIYLVLNRRAPSPWRVLPLKEGSIGFIFAGGAMVPVFHGLTSASLPAWLLFSCLCSLNCISIALWERELDRAQGRVSIATAFPVVGKLLAPMLWSLGLTSVASAFFADRGGVVFTCIATSALLLGMVHCFRNRLPGDERTALADLVLLTPLLALAFSLR